MLSVKFWVTEIIVFQYFRYYVFILSSVVVLLKWFRLELFQRYDTQALVEALVEAVVLKEIRHFNFARASTQTHNIINKTNTCVM